MKNILSLRQRFGQSFVQLFFQPALNTVDVFCPALETPFSANMHAFVSMCDLLSSKSDILSILFSCAQKGNVGAPHLNLLDDYFSFGFYLEGRSMDELGSIYSG